MQQIPIIESEELVKDMEMLRKEPAADTVLDVNDLRVYFNTEEGEIKAVDGVSFSMRRGRITALVGESGCGKSVTSYSILRLIQKPGKIMGGTITFHPREGDAINVTALDENSDALFDLRGGKISMIFQEPMTALSPVHTVGNQICEAILLHQDIGMKKARAKAIEMLRKVGIPGAEKRIDQYPFEMSGGMRQRVVIAMALVCNPEVLIADEPTTALDVTIQAQIMGLIKGLQRDLGTSTLLITHDLGVVAQIADDVAVMYLGRIVEHGPVRTIMKNPRHPYTLMLLKSLPSMAMDKERLPSIKGTIPSLNRIPKGCPFHPRCPFAQPGVCDTGDRPALQSVTDGHTAACVRLNNITASEFAGIDQVETVSEPMRPMQSVETILSVNNLCKYYPVRSKGFFKKKIGDVRASDGISFDLKRGETLGLVGESGCGKTTTGRSILRALDPTSGKVIFNFNGKSINLATLPEKELNPLRTQMQMIFQDPFSSLNPRMPVGTIVREPLDIHGLGSKAEREEKVAQMLEKVGLKPEHKSRYPHAFSGGQRQRIGIARALIMHPDLVVCDEAVSALDVSVQAQVINLLQDLQKELGLTYIFIAHDLSVVKHICDRIAVMYAGRIVELATTEQLFSNPMHPYTRALLSAVPNPDPDKPMNMELSGEVADPGNLPDGCAFHPRCGVCMDACGKRVPELLSQNDGRVVACHKFVGKGQI